MFFFTIIDKDGLPKQTKASWYGQRKERQFNTNSITIKKHPKLVSMLKHVYDNCQRPLQAFTFYLAQLCIFSCQAMHCESLHFLLPRLSCSRSSRLCRQSHFSPRYQMQHERIWWHCHTTCHHRQQQQCFSSLQRSNGHHPMIKTAMEPMIKTAIIIPFFAISLRIRLKGKSTGWNSSSPRQLSVN